MNGTWCWVVLNEKWENFMGLNSRKVGDQISDVFMLAIDIVGWISDFFLGKSRKIPTFHGKGQNFLKKIIKNFRNLFFQGIYFHFCMYDKDIRSKIKRSKCKPNFNINNEIGWLFIITTITNFIKLWFLKFFNCKRNIKLINTCSTVHSVHLTQFML